jgi:hypothetical protein
MPGPLITASDFRGRFDISEDIADGRITPHLGSASRRLRKWVGETNYAVAAGGADADMLADLQNAEAHLAYHFAIYGLNSPLSSKGVLATATATEGREVRRYLLPKETAELAQHFLDVAMEIAQQYMPAEDAQTGFASVVDEASSEASTRPYGGSCC